MPVSYSMTWEPGPRRWRKMYRGKVYTVSALDLGVTPTKDGSFRQANDWWTAKRAELDACPVKAPFSFAETELSRRLAWAREHEPKLAEELVLRIERLAGLKEGSEADLIEALGLLTTPDLDQRIAAVEKLGIEIPGSLHPFLLDGILGDEKLWPSRLATPTSRVPEERTVAAQVAKYLGRLRERVRSGRPSVAEYDLIERYLGEFAAWLVGDSAVDSITVDKWEDWYYHILRLPCSVETKKKRYRYPRTFVEWLVEKDVIREPANLASRKFRFEGGSRKVPTLTAPEVKALIEAAPGQLKLHLLLMANCGYTQTDISDLRPEQVDWLCGRIRRKRSKTEHHEDVPEVDYKLWPATFALLSRYGNRQGDWALLTRSGLPWVRDLMDGDGKRKKVDAIKSNYAHLRKKGFIRPMKLLRKTSATMIEGRREYSAYTSHFLGHSPRSIKDRSYAAPNKAIFDEVIDWLGQQYAISVDV